MGMDGYMSLGNEAALVTVDGGSTGNVWKINLQHFTINRATSGYK
ncbi:unnamed protein product [marine sediment metagenome]|uniref:Uncharacterized protein n=1 Tax=marine sediment metagenome TaxID=412755 RepID=X0TLN0_9ZZZZ